ncbi:MAG: NUDIX domain-containing protein [archaeon]
MQEELFEVIDASGKVVGLEKRSIVHSTGLLHKGIHGFVLDSKGRIFIQRRALGKRISPRKWDASVAEHLHPGESFEEAFKRGCLEELGLKAIEVEKIGGRRPRFKEGDIDDNEVVELFKSGFEGRIKLQREEVIEGKWVSKKELLQEMRENPEKFTEWLLGDRKFVELL